MTDKKLQDKALGGGKMGEESLQDDRQSGGESLRTNKQPGGESLQDGKPSRGNLQNENPQGKNLNRDVLQGGAAQRESEQAEELHGEEIRRQKLQNEIAWMKEMTEQGRTGPVLGGSIGVWWGLLSFVMMLVHWGALVGRLPVSITDIGWFWSAYVVIGLAGTIILARRMQTAPGAGTLSNRISGVAWMLAGAGIFSFMGGVVIATFVLGAPFWLFNLILPVAFICYGIAFGVGAALRGDGIGGVAAGASFVAALAMFPFVLGTSVYLLGALGVLAVGVVPVLARRLQAA